MEYIEEIRLNQSNPEKLEQLYRQAVQAGKANEFESDLQTCCQAAPDDLLLQAWYHRLQPVSQPASAQKATGPDWKLAIAFAILNGVLFWLISDMNWMFLDKIPYFILIGAPLAALLVIGFLTLAARLNIRRVLAVTALLLLCGLYVLWIVPTMPEPFQDHALLLLLLHLVLMSWISVGLALIGLRSSPSERFGFLIKSLEVFVTGGLYGMAIGAFGGITMGMFAALGVQVPELAVRLLFAGGAGMVPVIAVASIYNPHLSPFNQDFRQGLSKFIANMMRLLLPLTLLVMVLYLGFIPFNFMQPFMNRDVLMIYNAMLFAVMALLVGATPIRLEDLSDRTQTYLRRGLLAVAALAVIISLYALSAIVYRTILGGWTINRLAVIGWNLLNILLLVVLVIRLGVKGKQSAQETWVNAVYQVFSLGAIGYTSWSLFLILAVPLLFR